MREFLKNIGYMLMPKYEKDVDGKNGCLAALKWTHNIAAFVLGTIAGLEGIQWDHVTDPRLQIAYVVSTSVLAPFVPATLAYWIGMLVCLVIRLRDDRATQLVGRIWFWIISLLDAACVPAVFFYLRAHPLDTWIVGGSAATGLALKLTIAFGGTIFSIIKGAPAAAGGAVVQHYVAKWLQRREAAQMKSRDGRRSE